MVTFTDYFSRDVDSVNRDKKISGNQLMLDTDEFSLIDDKEVFVGNKIDEKTPMSILQTDGEGCFSQNDVDENLVGVSSQVEVSCEDREKRSNEARIRQRQSSRKTSKPDYLKDYCKTIETDRCCVDYCYKAAPNTYNEAVNSDEADLWRKAMSEEINSLKDNKLL